MKLEIDYIFGNIVDKIFSAGTLLLIMAGIVIFTLFKIVESDNAYREELKKLTETCYSQGMVVVNTEAGERCVDPRNLVKVK